MTQPPGASLALTAYLALISLISFGGIPGALPDLRNFVVGANGWLTDREFANCFAVVQAIPGPNMILLTSFIGWKVGGFPAAAAAGLATFGPSCALCFAGYRWWDRFRDAPWQRIVRRGLAPVTIGLVIAGGAVMARIGDASWASLALTLAAIGIVLGTRLSPLWVIGLGALIGALGLV